MIKKIINRIKQHIKKERIRKYYEVRGEWIKFFTIRQQHLGTVELPPHVLADEQMKIIMATNQLNYYYKKIMNYKKQIAA